MKTFRVYIIAIITLLQLDPTFQDACGQARIVQVSDDRQNASRLHFPWAGTLYSVVNKTETGVLKYICGATLLTTTRSVTGEQQL